MRSAPGGQSAAAADEPGSSGALPGAASTPGQQPVPARSSRHPPRLSRRVPRAAAPFDREAAGCARSADRTPRASSWRSPFAAARSAPRRRRAWRVFRPAPPSALRCPRGDDQPWLPLDNRSTSASDSLASLTGMSQPVAPHPAAEGRQVRTGLRQSIPSSM